MRQRIYIDTSVIGGYYDVEFEEVTRQFFERIADKEFDVYFSEVNETELVNAPQRVRDVKNLIPVDCFHLFIICKLLKYNHSLVCPKFVLNMGVSLS